MSRYLLSAVVILSLVAAIGCGGGKQLTQSYWAPSLQPTDIKTSGYNESTKLSWLVSNDSSNIYINARTADLTTQKAIAMFGLSVYLDTTSKKKKECFVTFPYQENGAMMMGPPPGGQGQQSHLQLLLSKSGNLYWQNGEATYLINTLVEKSAFSGKAEIDPQGVMIWQTKIPLVAIWPTGYAAGKDLSVGVEVSYGKPDADFSQMGNGSGVNMQNSSVDPDSRRPVGTVAPNTIYSDLNNPNNGQSSGNFPRNSGSMPVSTWIKMELGSSSSSGQ